MKKAAAILAVAIGCISVFTGICSRADEGHRIGGKCGREGRHGRILSLKAPPPM